MEVFDCEICRDGNSILKPGGMRMNKKEKNFKLSYESDGKMDNKKNKEIQKNKSANFFNVTPDSE
jgi:hypothetical protein